MNIAKVKNEAGLHLVLLSLPPFSLRLPATDTFVIGCMQVSQFLAWLAKLTLSTSKWTFTYAQSFCRAPLLRSELLESCIANSVHVQ